MRKTLFATTVFLATAFNAHGLEPTPAQTEGPFFPTVKPSDVDADLTRVGNGAVSKGTLFRLVGRVVDVKGVAIENARVEIWQTDHQGIYLHPGDPKTDKRDQSFQFYGETRTASDGAFSFRTIEPGLYTGRARHIHAKITPPGGRTLTTQFYFKADLDLKRDFVARRLGRALETVTVSPVPVAGSADPEATVVVVVKR